MIQQAASPISKIFKLKLALLSLGMAIVATTNLPCHAVATHPIRKFFTSLIIRTTIGKPREISPDELALQELCNQSDKYIAVKTRLEQIGFLPVPGQMRIVQIPVFRRVLWVIPILKGHDPRIFALQPTTNQDKTQVKVTVIATHKKAVLGVAVLDPDAILTPSGTPETPAYKRSFLQCAEENFDCAKPCTEEAIKQSYILVGMVANPVHTTGAYIIAVLGSEECGGCGIQALIDTVIDYGMAAIPAPTSIVTHDTSSN